MLHPSSHVRALAIMHALDQRQGQTPDAKQYTITPNAQSLSLQAKESLEHIAQLDLKTFKENAVNAYAFTLESRQAFFNSVSDLTQKHIYYGLTPMPMLSHTDPSIVAGTITIGKTTAKLSLMTADGNTVEGLLTLTIDRQRGKSMRFINTPDPDCRLTIKGHRFDGFPEMDLNRKFQTTPKNLLTDLKVALKTAETDIQRILNDST